MIITIILSPLINLIPFRLGLSQCIFLTLVYQNTCHQLHNSETWYLPAHLPLTANVFKYKASSQLASVGTCNSSLSTRAYYGGYSLNCRIRLVSSQIDTGRNQQEPVFVASRVVLPSVNPNNQANGSQKADDEIIVIVFPMRTRLHLIQYLLLVGGTKTPDPAYFGLLLNQLSSPGESFCCSNFTLFLLHI